MVERKYGKARRIGILDRGTWCPHTCWQSGVSSDIIEADDHEPGRSHPRQSSPPPAGEAGRSVALRGWLAAPACPEGVPARDRNRELRWIADNRSAYAGQWVAVEGDRLVVADMDARKVFSAAKAAGIEILFVVHILSEDSLPFVPGW